jgi:hypothetical protein
MKKLLLIAVAMLALSHAAGWQEMSFVALMASTSAVALMFMLGYAMNSNELKFSAKDEAVQVLLTAILVGAFTLMSSQLTALHAGTDAGITASITALSASNNVLMGAAKGVGVESSRSIWCSFSAAGFGVNACGAFGMLGPALSQGLQITSVGLAELSFIKEMSSLVSSTIFTVFFPLGLFLRTFKFTRGAGGLMIGVSVAFYVVMPIVHSYLYDSASAFESTMGYSGSASISVPTCNPYDLDAQKNENKAIGAFRQTLSSGVAGRMVYEVLIYATLIPAVSLLAAASTIRYISSLAGAEVDASQLTRFL